MVIKLFYTADGYIDLRAEAFHRIGGDVSRILDILGRVDRIVTVERYDPSGKFIGEESLIEKREHSS